MFTTEELIVQYDKYSDDELFELHSTIETYSNEAKEAFNIIISRKGGLENLIKRQKEKKIISNEIERIRRDVIKLSHPDVDISFLKKMITSTILSPEKVAETIDTAYAELEKERADKKITPRSILGSIIGGGIASVLGGVLWGLQLIYSRRIFIILLVGLVLLCYGIIKLSTKQSNKNVVVLIATIIAVIISLAIGQLLYQVIGFQS